jgi:hypothetical protein
VVEIRTCGDPIVKHPNPLLEAVVSIQSFIEEAALWSKCAVREF